MRHVNHLLTLLNHLLVSELDPVETLEMILAEMSEGGVEGLTELKADLVAAGHDADAMCIWGVLTARPLIEDALTILVWLDHRGRNAQVGRIASAVWCRLDRPAGTPTVAARKALGREG